MSVIGASGDLISVRCAASPWPNYRWILRLCRWQSSAVPNFAKARAAGRQRITLHAMRRL